MANKLKILFALALCGFVLSSCGNKTPDTDMWDGKQLAKVKKAIAENDPVYTKAYEILINRAEAELQKPNPTVMDKPMTPASGDKHDYMSIGRYWWPNPDTPDGLPYVRHDGKSNPELNRYDRQRLGAMASSVVNLGLAYYLSGEQKYADKAVSILDTWFIDPATRMNPNMNFGQTIPGHNEGKGRAEGVIDTYSFVPMIDAITLLWEGKALSKEQLLTLKKWFDDYTTWMTQSEIGQDEQSATNNHSVAYDVQLALFSRFAGKHKLAVKTLKEFPKKRIFAQIEPDGSQPRELGRTTGMGYSTFNLTHFLDMADIARKQKIKVYHAKSEDGRSIDAAIGFLTPYLGKSVEAWPYQQISGWDGALRNLTLVLYRADHYNPEAGYMELYEKYGTDPDYMFTLLYY